MVRLLDYNPDQTDKRMSRIVIGLVTTIVLGILLYQQIIPYGPHDEIIKVSMITGVIAAIGIQAAIHLLISKRKKPHV